jgi:hypothetical protein
MKLQEGIRTHGFRKWYERELLQSHAHLVLAFACAIGLVAAFEAAWRFRGTMDQLTDGVAGIVCAVVGLWALRRYLYLLHHAEAAANQADCPQCKAYGRLEVAAEPAAPGSAGANRKQAAKPEPGPDNQPGDALLPVAVRCRQCQHRWTIVS